MTDSLSAAQQAVIAALSSDINVQNLLGATPRLYDHVPPEAVFPYIAFGPLHVAAYDARFENGLAQTITLNVWSRYRGGQEAREIFQAVYAVLHRATLTVTGQVFLSSEFDSADFAPDTDGLTYHAALRFTLITQNT